MHFIAVVQCSEKFLLVQNIRMINIL